MGLKCLRWRHSVRATSTTTVTTSTSATTTSSYLDVALVFPSPTPLSSFNISPSLPPLALILSRRFGKRLELAILFTLEVILLYCVSIGFNPVGRPAVNSIFAAIIVTTTIYYIFFYTTSL